MITRDKVQRLLKKAQSREWMCDEDIRATAIALYEDWLKAHPAPKMSRRQYGTLHALIKEFNRLDPMDAKKLAGKIMLALEFWENHGRFKDAAKG